MVDNQQLAPVDPTAEKEQGLGGKTFGSTARERRRTAIVRPLLHRNADAILRTHRRVSRKKNMAIWQS